MSDGPTFRVRRVVRQRTVYLELRNRPVAETAIGERISVRKVVFESRDDRRRAVLTGEIIGSPGYTRATNFDMGGYDKYRPAPRWVRDLEETTR